MNNEIDAPEGWSYEAARAAEDSLDRVAADSSAYAQLPPRASQSALRAFQSYADRFDRQAEWLSKSLIFLCIPMLAGWLLLIYPSRWWSLSRRGLLPYVVQATHVMCISLFILASFAVSGLFLAVGGMLFGTGPVDLPEWLIEWQPTVLLILYIAPALKHVHDSSWVGTGVRAAVDALRLPGNPAGVPGSAILYWILHGLIPAVKRCSPVGTGRRKTPDEPPRLPRSVPNRSRIVSANGLTSAPSAVSSAPGTRRRCHRAGS